ncbi:hypothetical protein [Streptomyces sp. NBC_01207]|uniref:hypothetical protein n=1 Tax=Streptomyces sp. NBC_01207 TaxID=2903772 RepID=UPI002E0EF531|nr:hypothetical protein OG457_00415 [Streptomyces sp. NBC_01207]
MSTPTNGSEHTRWNPARHGYGTPPPTCWPARTGALARVLGHQDKEQENTDGGEA